MNYFFTFISVLALSIGLHAQDCSVGLVTYCYDNSEDVTFTYCPDNPATQVISVTLLDYAIESGYDLMTFYDGTDTSAPVLATYDGSGTSGYSYIGTAVADGGTGCVTVRIESDNIWSCTSGEIVGNTSWNVECQTLCMPPTAVISASNTELCATTAENQTIAEVVTFDASASTHANGTSFVAYYWDFGDGNTETTVAPTTTHSFADEGGYLVQVIVEDDLGCTSTILEEVLIQVAGVPSFALGSDADPSGICAGTSINLTDGTSPYVWNEVANQPDPDPTALPDGTGDSYSSSVIFNQFGDNDIIEDGANMLIIVDMEHSYMGDLDMEIVCPDGTRIKLLDFATNNMGNCNVGGAGEYASGETAPGPGQEYMFDSNAAILFSSFDGPGSTSVLGVDIPSGTYAPDESFAGANGCPINGEWRIEITDNYNLDDGTLFTWSIYLGATDLAKIELASFATTTAALAWTGEGVTGTVGIPSSNPTSTYSLMHTDNFGCDFEDQLDILVLDPSDPICIAASGNDISGEIFRDFDGDGSRGHERPRPTRGTHRFVRRR